MSPRQTPRRPAKHRRRTVAGPSPAQLAAAMVDAVAPDLAHDDPLQAQLVASYLVADRLEQHWQLLADAEDETAADAVPRPTLGLVRLVAELREPALRDAALALVLALASLDPEDETVQDAAVEAVKKFRFLGAKLPAWAEHVLEPELLGVWSVRDVFSDAFTLYVGTRHAGLDAPAHCVAARIEWGSHPALVDIFVSEGPEVLVPKVERALAEDEQAALLRLEELTPARAGTILWDAIADAEETFGEELGDEAFELFALLEARAALLGAAMDAASDEERTATPHDSRLDDLDLDALLDAFRTSDAYAATDGTHEELAGAIAAWAGGRSPVGRFGPNLALELLGDLAEAATDDEERALLIDHAIPTARAWARFTAAEANLPDGGLAELEQVLDATVHEFEHLVRQGPQQRSALTDQLMELMLEDGVDVGDQAELDAWSQRWNALTDEERLARLETLA